MWSLQNVKCEPLNHAFTLLFPKKSFQCSLNPIMQSLPMIANKGIPRHFATLVIFGYLETKNHGLLLLNWEAQPSFHTQCQCGTYSYPPYIANAI
jgi:hypothetical protein